MDRGRSAETMLPLAHLRFLSFSSSSAYLELSDITTFLEFGLQASQQWHCSPLPSCSLAFCPSGFPGGSTPIGSTPSAMDSWTRAGTLTRKHVHYTMQTRRICGERTGNNDPFLGLEEALHEETHTSAATSEPALLTDGSGAEPNGSAPLVLLCRRHRWVSYPANSAMIRAHSAVRGGTSRVGASCPCISASASGSRGAWMSACR